MMQTIFTSISVRWRIMRRRHRLRRNTIFLLRQSSDHMLKDIGLHEPRSPDDPWL